MSMNKSSIVAESLNRKIREIWLKEPEEVKQLRDGKVKGAFCQISPAILYAESETREMVDYLWYFKNLVASGEIDLGAAKAVVCKVLDLKQDKWRRWYKLEEVTSVIRETILGLEAAETREEFLSALEPLQIYIGKYNFWLDNCIPWMTICFTMDSMLGNAK